MNIIENINIMKSFKISIFSNNKVIRNSIYIIIGSIVSQVCRFILVALISRNFDSNEFGLWTAISSIGNILIVSDFGLGNALRNNIASIGAIGSKDEEDMFLAVFYSCIALYFSLSIIFFIVSWNIPIEKLFKSSNTQIGSMGKSIFIIIQILIWVGIPIGLFNVVFMAYEENYISAKINIFSQIFLLILCIIAIAFKASIKTIAILPYILGNVISIWGTWYLLKRRNWHIRKIKLKTILLKLVSISKSSILFFVNQISYSVIMSSPTIAVAALLDISNAGNFNLIQKVCLLAYGVHSSILNTVWSTYSIAFSKGEITRTKVLLKNTIVFTLIVFLLFSIVFIIFGNEILRLITGSMHYEKSLMYIIMSIWVLLLSLNNTISTLLNSINKITVSTIFIIAIAIFTIPTISFGIKIFGMFGVPITMSMYALITLIVIVQQVKVVYTERSEV